MRRIARCVLAALLAAAFASPVYASPPPVLAPVAVVAPAPMRASAIALPSTGRHFVAVVVAPVATGLALPPTVAAAKAYALEQLGWTQYACLDSIIRHESRWRVTVWNGKGSGAYGLGQAKPGSKMATFGVDWEWNAVTQVRWVIWYATSKYGSPCGAAWFRDQKGWY